jgi:hypothetical protein
MNAIAPAFGCAAVGIPFLLPNGTPPQANVIGAPLPPPPPAAAAKSRTAKTAAHVAKRPKSALATESGGHGAATWTGTKPGAAGSPSSFALASRRQAKIRLGEIPCLRATSDTFAPAPSVSATILALSSGNQWRRCLPLAKISTRIGPMTSNHNSQGHMLPRSRPKNKAVLTGWIRCSSPAPERGRL